jgi:hypothetical protein
LVSQPFLYIGQYTIVMVDVTTQEYDYNIFYIDTYYNIPLQAKGWGSTWSLNRKAVNRAVGSGLLRYRQVDHERR